jgi:hypothetical protein
MKKKVVRKRINTKLVFFVFVVGVLGVGGWFFWHSFYSQKECKTWSCFSSHLEKCERATFVGGTDMVFQYTILGKDSKTKCAIDVKLLQGDYNNQDSMKLQGKSMTCYLPVGAVMLPEKNVKNCHGILKEELQEIIIIKLHTYIVQNLGRINLETMNIPKELVEQAG